jgi:hypothetical protein
LSEAVTAPGDDAALKLVLCMVDTLEPLALAELERALRLRLRPPSPPGQQRLAELGFLAGLLEREGTGSLDPDLAWGAGGAPRAL